MAAITLISKELLVHTVDLAADHSLVTLGPRRIFLFPLNMFHSSICTHSSVI